MNQDQLEEIRRDRGSIYGDPYENHAGIGAAWAPLLQPHVRAIMEGEPVPAHVVALCMAAMKLNRMRRVYHEDNFVDAEVYLGFAQNFQERWAGPKPRPYERVYVAGPYSDDNPAVVEANVHRAVLTTNEIMQRGHDAHCPHSATHPVEMETPGELDYERWMRLDLDIIRYWATCLFVIERSPGVDREIELARDLGLRIAYSLDEIEVVR